MSTINLPTGQVATVHFFAFASEQELNEALLVLNQAKESGVEGPVEVTLSNGDRVKLYPHEQWLFDQLMRFNVWWMILTVIGAN